MITNNANFLLHGIVVNILRYPIQFTIRGPSIRIAHLNRDSMESQNRPIHDTHLTIHLTINRYVQYTSIHNFRAQVGLAEPKLKKISDYYFFQENS